MAHYKSLFTVTRIGVLAACISLGIGIYYIQSRYFTAVPEISISQQTTAAIPEPTPESPEVETPTPAEEKVVAPEKIEEKTAAQKPCHPNVGFSSCEQKPNRIHLKIVGTMPKWINGDFLAIGPGIFEINGNKATHWLDGLAMIHNFSFHHGQVTYNNRIINSLYYLEAMKKGKITGSAPEKKQSTWSKLSSAFSSTSRPIYDNTNVNVIQFRNTYVALTESVHHWCLDHKTLKTLHPFTYTDTIDAQFACAHPLYDPETKHWYGVLINYAHNSDYIIYKRAENSAKREVITTMSVGYPAYIHSFAMTKNYFIITEAPFNVSPYDLLLTDKAYIESFTWKPKQGTQFIIVDRVNGKIVGRFKTDAFFTLHHINAQEKDENIIVDLIAYNDPTIIKAFYLDLICSENPNVPNSEIRRYTLNLNNKKVGTEILYPGCAEMPQINSKYQSKNYRFLYCTMNGKPGTLADQICKIDVHNGQKIAWQEAGCYPNEAVYVQSPHHHGEDDGVLISHVLDTNKKQTFVLVLDAKNCTELARAYIQGHVPFTVHCKFFQEHNHAKV